MTNDRYTNWKKIGEGAFGAVWKAFDRDLDQTVAIKLLKADKADQASLVDALFREVKISRALRHPYICPIHDLYKGPRGVGTVMDLIDGCELTEWMKAHADALLATAPERLQLMRKLAEALAFAHTRIVHRDLKPDNVFLMERDVDRPVIMDFGASTIGKTPKGDRTIAGTPRYMAPEQWEAPEKVDPRSDLFALGILGYQLFTNRIPPTSLREILKTKTPPKIDADKIPPPSAFNAAAPPDLDRIIIQLMSYRREDRFANAQEAADALAAVVLESPDLAGRGADAQEDPHQEITALPGGTFHMGSAPGKGNPNERPARRVALSPFRIQRFPVTNRAFQRFLTETGYASPLKAGAGPAPPPDHPVAGVTWAEAREYARWLGGDLPTEAQWEYAAKGGARFPAYPWGDDPPTPARANIDNVSSGVSSVGACPSGANAFGLREMCGNVWEWCLDRWDPKRLANLGHDVENPVNNAGPEVHVLRGGGFDSFATQGRCAFRFQAPASSRGRSVGFRVVFAPLAESGADSTESGADSTESEGDPA